MTRPCICQPTGTIPVHGEVRRMRWCRRCGELYSLSVRVVPGVQGPQRGGRAARAGRRDRAGGGR